jgi:hypothetical protein
VIVLIATLWVDICMLRRPGNDPIDRDVHVV